MKLSGEPAPPTHIIDIRTGAATFELLLDGNAIATFHMGEDPGRQPRTLKTEHRPGVMMFAPELFTGDMGAVD